MIKEKSLRPSPTALLNPRCDASFKAMFTANSKESNAALKDFISTILNRSVKEIELVQNEPVVQIVGQSQMSFDVGVKFDDGEKIDLEMQSREEDYDYASRAEIQLARLLSTNTKSGDNWSTPAAYQISVLNFEFDKDDNSPLSWYTMKKENGARLSNKLNVIFFDLIKIHKLLGKPVNELSKLEKWGLFLSYADNERYTNYIDEIVNTEEGIMEAKSSLSMVSQDEINWARQNSVFIAMQDRSAILHNAEKRGIEKGLKQGLKKGIQQGIEKGLKQGIQQGIEQGREQGEHNAKIEIAKKALAQNVLTTEQIAQISGLSEAEVQNLL